MRREDDDMIPPFAKNIFSCTPEKPPSLLGGYCPVCDRFYFPGPGRCPDCLGPVALRPIGRKGTIYSYTVVRTPPLFDLPSPYAVGYIDLAQTGLRVFALFDPTSLDHLAIGAQVVLNVTSLGTDSQGQPCLRPYFSVKQEQKEK